MNNLDRFIIVCFTTRGGCCFSGDVDFNFFGNEFFRDFLLSSSFHFETREILGEPIWICSLEFSSQHIAHILTDCHLPPLAYMDVKEIFLVNACELKN